MSAEEHQPHESPPELVAMLAEYSSLRNESLAAIGHRMTATNFTFAALTVMVAGLLSGKVQPLVAAALLVFVIPQLAKAGLLVWLGEYHRSQRAGRHIAGLERRINRFLGADYMRWESGLASKSTHMGYPYAAVVVLMLGAGYVAELLGIALAVEDLADTWSTLAVVAACVGAVAALAVFELAFHRRFMAWWREAKIGRQLVADDD